MPRLLRPPIPLKIKCRVALRQLGEMWPDDVLEEHHGALGRLLESLLASLAELLACPPADLRLDHNPALGARQKVFKKGVHVDYIPPANDPDALIYREAHAHHIKTNVRGDGAQHPDRVLIKRERRRNKPHKPVDFLKNRRKSKIKQKSKWPKRPFPNRRHP